MQAGLISFSDLDTMTIEELFDAHEILDIQHQIEQVDIEESKHGKGT